MTIVGTRPEVIKMSRVIAEFDRYTQHILVHTGQNHSYELNQIFFNDLNIRQPEYYLEVAEYNAALTIARIIERVDAALEVEKPDAVLLYGDTNSCLAIIPAKRRKIPTFHMEAGNRCFDQRVPEELNRRIVDHLSDINLVLSEHARRNLIAEGIRSETIIKTGSHMREVLEYYKPNIERSEILANLNLRAGKYFLVSAHREETVDNRDALLDLLLTLNTLAEKYDIPVIFSTHPRTRKRLASLEDASLDHRIRFLEPFGFFDYIKLQLEALCVISDSGTLTEEAALLNLSAVAIRETHERPEGMDAGVLIMCGLKSSSVLDAVQVTLAQVNSSPSAALAVPDYSGGSVSKQILRVVLSYVEYINRTIWSKKNVQALTTS